MEEKLEYYLVKPNLKQLYGKKVFKDTEFEENTEDGRIHQIFKDLTLTTIIKSETEQGFYKVKENSEISVTVPEETILIWIEVEGFVIHQVQITSLSELKKEIENMKEIYKESNVGN